MIDRPGPWGTGPFTLVEGYSSISTRCGIMRDKPFACTWLIEGEDRADNLVLEANRSHWNTARGPRLERVVFRNDLTPEEALELCCTTEGEMDIVTEVSAADAQKVLDSEHAELVTCDANRVLVGIFNRHPSDVPLSDVRMRKALNLAVDFQKIIDEGLNGYANPLPALTPAWSGGYSHGIEPYAHDAAHAKNLMKEVGWPPGRKLRIATPAPFEGVARMVGADIEAALGIGTDIIVVPADQILAGSKVLVEKKIPPPWDVLIHGWFDLSSEAPPAAVHREFCGADGAFRAGPEVPMFDKLFAEMASQLDGAKLAEVAEQIDRYVYDQALALFLCAPKALYAVNKHVKFGPYRTTFELAETEVDDEHWSRRSSGKRSGSEQAAPSQQDKSSTGYSGAGC